MAIPTTVRKVDRSKKGGNANDVSSNVTSYKEQDTHVPPSGSISFGDAAGVAATATAEDDRHRQNMMDLLQGVRSHWEEFQSYGTRSFEEVVAMGKRLLDLRNMVKQGLAFGPNTWKAWVAEKQQRPADADDYLPFGLRQANRYISVYSKHKEGKIAFGPDCFTFAREPSNDKTPSNRLDLGAKKEWRGTVRWNDKGRFNITWQDDEFAKLMDTDNTCCTLAIEAARLAFCIVARTKKDEGVMEPMLDTLIKLSKANGDAPKLAAAMKKAVGA